MGLGKTLQCSAFLAGVLFNTLNIVQASYSTATEALACKAAAWCIVQSRRQPTCHAGMLGGKLIRRAMVVAPKTLLGQWAKELTVCGLDHSIFEYYGPSATQR